MDAYRELERRFARLAHLEGAAAVLGWDQQVMMPPGGAEARTEQLSALELVRHEMLTDPALGELLDRAAGETLAPDQGANLAAMRRRWVHASALSPRLVEALTRQTLACELRWRAAWRDDDFAGFAPVFEALVELSREAGAAKGEALGCAPYDALLSVYEPDLRAADIGPLFDTVAAALPDLIAAARAHQAAAPAPTAPSGPFAQSAQEALFRRLMATVGFDSDVGRLDVSVHPFCSGVPGDVRITTRYDEADFTTGMMGVLHETGHALYELGLPTAWRGQPAGEALSMSLHESQSLLIEMQACRSPEFMAFVAPLLRATFGDDRAFAPDNLYRLAIRVRPGFIRVDADEITYPAHILLRFRLEQALIGGDLAVRDLPGAWADGMAELLGIVPASDREGCLQDIHWPAGAFGNFPTYTLGAMIAAQLFDAARRTVPGLMEAIGRGDFAPLRHWLRENVHGRGALMDTAKLLARASGRPLDPGIYLAHLERRYLDA